jgi:WD40 repeat protein
MQVLIYSPDGRCLFKYSAYESGLGVKSVGWSPCGQFLAVGSYDQAVRTLNHLTWKTFAEFTHASSIRSPCNAAIYKVDLSIYIINSHFSRFAVCFWVLYSAYPYLHSYCPCHLIITTTYATGSGCPMGA